MIRNGYLARWQGVDYDASPSPDGTVRLYAKVETPGFEPVAAGRYRRVVPPGEVDEFRYVRTVCEWQGARFAVIGSHDAWLRLEYLDDDPAVAQTLGLEWVDVGVHQGWAPRAEVTGLREEIG